MKKDLISINDLTFEEIEEIYKLSDRLKKKTKAGKKHHLLKGKTLGMIFQKSSTRTRVSFEVGMYQLGGTALFLSSTDLQLGRGETIKDTASVLSRYLDGIMIRTFNHQDAIDLGKYSTIPIINGLTDLLHPCQALGDIFTILEDKNIRDLSKVKGLTITFVGDGNNVANSLIHLSSKLGIHIRICSPSGYEPNEEVMKAAEQNNKVSHGSVILEQEPIKAVKHADYIYTDVWASMGQEAEAEERKKVFVQYQLNDDLLSHATRDAKVMHCLPAHRGQEITDSVMDGTHSIIIDQAENRLHVQKAIMVLLMRKSKK